MKLEQLENSYKEHLEDKERLEGVYDRIQKSKGITHNDRDIILGLLNEEIETAKWGLIGLERSIGEAKMMEDPKVFEEWQSNFC